METSGLPELCIRFEPGYQICNYRCSYCIIGWDEERFINIVDKIKLPYSIELLLGVEGEIFTSKTLLMTVKDLSRSSNIRSIYLITNLSVSQNKLDAFLAEANEDKLAFASTLHREQAKFDEFIDKVVSLHKRGIPVIVGSVAAPKKLNELQELKALLEGHGVPLYVNALLGEDDGKQYPRDYSFSERRMLKSLIYSPHEYDHMVNLRNTSGELCKAGSSYFYLNFDGKIFRCGEEKNRGFAPIGNLLADDLSLSKKPYACHCTSCFCPIESLSTVRFDKHYLPTKNRRIYSKKPLLQRLAERIKS